MKETIKVIASAWSTAFIILFLLLVTADRPADEDTALARQHLTYYLSVGAITGAGWLWARYESKRRRRDA